MEFRKIILLSLSAILALPLFLNTEVFQKPVYNGREKFDPSLLRINSLDKLETYTDSMAQACNASNGSIEYFVILKNVISERFYHGFSRFNLSENWLAVVAEKMSNLHLASKVWPEDIMKLPYGGCSQQAAVMMEIAKRKGVSYRHIGFPHHYAAEFKLKGHWYFFDSDMEPNIFRPEDRLHENWIKNLGTLKSFYRRDKSDMDYLFGKNNSIISVGPENEAVAANARVFQSVTGIISKIAFCFPLLFFLVRVKKSPRRKAKFQMYAMPRPQYAKMINLYPTISA